MSSIRLGPPTHQAFVHLSEGPPVTRAHENQVDHLHYASKDLWLHGRDPDPVLLGIIGEALVEKVLADCCTPVGSWWAEVREVRR